MFASEIFTDSASKLALGTGQMFHRRTASKYWPSIWSRVLCMRPSGVYDGFTRVNDVLEIGLTGGRESNDWGGITFLYSEWCSFAPKPTELELYTGFYTGTWLGIESDPAELAPELPDYIRDLVEKELGEAQAAEIINRDWLSDYPLSYVLRQLKKPQSRSERLRSLIGRGFEPHHSITLAQLGPGIRH